MSDAFVDVDLHDMTTDEARIEIKRALKTVSKFTYQIRLIHGFNREMCIRDRHFPFVEICLFCIQCYSTIKDCIQVFF